MKNKLLFIATSHDTMGSSGKKTGIWAEEITLPYEIFTKAGYEVDVYSPKGGKIIFDPNSIKPVGENNENIDNFLSLGIQAKVLDQLEDSKIKEYSAIFLPGGHGAMWDLSTEDSVANILTQANKDGKIIAALCHGVAGLVNAKNEAGDALVNNKNVSSFTDSEEIAAGLDNIVPFKLESKLRELGGNFKKGENWTEFAVRDGNLVTGQNPASSAQVANMVLAILDTP